MPNTDPKPASSIQNTKTYSAQPSKTVYRDSSKHVSSQEETSGTNILFTILPTVLIVVGLVLVVLSATVLANRETIELEPRPMIDIATSETAQPEPEPGQDFGGVTVKERPAPHGAPAPTQADTAEQVTPNMILFIIGLALAVIGLFGSVVNAVLLRTDVSDLRKRVKALKGMKQQNGPAAEPTSEEKLAYAVKQIPTLEGSVAQQAATTVQNATDSFNGSAQSSAYGQQPGYPAQASAYGQQSGYPAQSSAYGQQPGYPAQSSAYGQQQGYPAQASAYGQQPSYPAQPSAYGQGASAYPASSSAYGGDPLGYASQAPAYTPPAPVDPETEANKNFNALLSGSAQEAIKALMTDSRYEGASIDAQECYTAYSGGRLDIPYHVITSNKAANTPFFLNKMNGAGVLMYFNPYYYETNNYQSVGMQDVQSQCYILQAYHVMANGMELNQQTLGTAAGLRIRSVKGAVLNADNIVTAKGTIELG